ncbi:unnamed protein product [Lepeophtheirus salmonis]|uniref:(salmon louse) hypothetical protein n=1 Tax=Lepeophtheirus salmonis TaxID=72036 RepID=A0A7R8CMZ1_LEPSM|nr:unnamed protein product [Lepeophtheirus salmonis]CAF2868295.1 unnamed protein product [Lepeophtheirus salmonis]
MSKLMLLIVVSLFLPYIQQQQQSSESLSESTRNVKEGPWFKFLPGLLSESETLMFYSLDVNKDGLRGQRPTTVRPPPPPPSNPRINSDKIDSIDSGLRRVEEQRKKLLLIASQKAGFLGIWPWIVFRLVLACGFFASAFAMIIQNFTMNFGQCSEWDLINVLNILSAIMFANVYVVYSYYWKKKSYTGPPLLPMSAPSGSHHPMYSSIGQGSEETTITMELDDVISLTPAQRDAVEAAEIMDHKAGLVHKYSSFWETQQPSFLSKPDPNATL